MTCSDGDFFTMVCLYTSNFASSCLFLILGISLCINPVLAVSHCTFSRVILFPLIVDLDVHMYNNAFSVKARL